ncbi:LapA family protein [Mesobacterium sp. TK19101]|uniref:LapA family protein n=1 Tax=Mesobacterium hydrothermale TaxID=3111907 RepID=A0ABU6HCX0_9RHOB|nr:LapA family protein [Mesobacterium sp. TK19101]MEC3860313.1 LapA family protein [Mesobacterium sp. TK19101]
MRYIRYAFLGALAIVLMVVALANRATVTLNTLPDRIAEIPGMGPFALSIELPLFLVIFAGIAAGLMIGFVWEYLREHKHRADAARKGGEVRKLERELRRVKGQRDQGKDEVLALLDDVR